MTRRMGICRKGMDIALFDPFSGFFTAISLLYDCISREENESSLIPLISLHAHTAYMHDCTFYEFRERGVAGQWLSVRWIVRASVYGREWQIYASFIKHPVKLHEYVNAINS